MVEIILVVALVLLAFACIGALAYIAKGINKNNFKWLDVTKELVFEFSQKQRELEEFAFIEAKERRVYVGMAEKKIDRMFSHPQPSPEDFRPQPSIDMTDAAQPRRSLTVDEYFEDADIGMEAGARRRRTAREIDQDGSV